MPASRRDQLAECNTERQPIAEFKEAWCGRCVNPECTRSLFGQSRFDLRVNTWEDRLFKNPPKMDARDPRYKEIAGKRFLSLDVGPAPELRSWVDPSQDPAPIQVVQVGVPKVAEPVVAEPVSVPTPEVPKVSPEPVLTEISSINTPFQGGRMLSGVNRPQAAPKDPWSAPTPAENVVPVGGRVKFKGSGV